MKRARKQFRLVKRYLGCVARDIKRQLVNNQELQSIFADLLGKTDKLLTQQKHDKNKLYSLHAPETECIAKSKAHKKYEFGVKTSFVTTHKNNFIVGIEAMHGNPYDRHTLKAALDQVEELTGKRPTDSYVGLGYRGHSEAQTTVHIARTKNALKTATLRRDMKRRSAIEPVIGHLKNDGLFGRNYLKNRLGDRLNALLCGIGYDLRLLLRKFRIFCLWILAMLLTFFLSKKQFCVHSLFTERLLLKIELFRDDYVVSTDCLTKFVYILYGA
jgi:transposase, IS5 family